MFCHKCGTQLNDEELFCHKCGSKAITDDRPDSADDKPSAAPPVKNPVLINDKQGAVPPETGSVMTDNKQGTVPPVFTAPSNGTELTVEFREYKSDDTLYLIIDGKKKAKMKRGDTVKVAVSAGKHKIELGSMYRFIDVPSICAPFKLSVASLGSTYFLDCDRQDLIIPSIPRCPKCYSNNLSYIQETEVKTYTEGYKAGNGCLGWLLLGPLGLLCGLCGRETDSITIEKTFWRCNSCGHTFREKPPLVAVLIVAWLIGMLVLPFLIGWLTNSTVGFIVFSVFFMFPIVMLIINTIRNKLGK